MKTSTLALLTVATVLGGVKPCRADLLLYTDQAVATGTLGASTFTNAHVTVAFIGVTATVYDCATQFCNDVGTATVTIAGLGTAEFTDSMRVFDDPLFVPVARAGIADLSCVGCTGSVLDTFSSAVFGSYDLKGPIGPVTGNSFFRSDLTYGTDRGGLKFSSVGSTSTFTATAVPEPASATLFGIAVASIIFVRLRQPSGR